MDSSMTPNLSLARPTMAGAGRRRPSADRRVSASIPEENRIAMAEILEASKNPSTERLDAMEKAFKERLMKLEEEMGLMRAALLKAGIAIPEPAPKASSPSVQALKKKPVAAPSSLSPRSSPKAPSALAGPPTKKEAPPAESAPAEEPLVIITASKEAAASTASTSAALPSDGAAAEPNPFDLVQTISAPSANEVSNHEDGTVSEKSQGEILKTLSGSSQRLSISAPTEPLEGGGGDKDDGEEMDML